MAGETTGAVSTILDCSKEVRQSIHRKNSKICRKTELSGRGNGSKLFDGRMKGRAIGNLAQTNRLLESNRTFHHQDTKIFYTYSNPRAPCDDMFVSMTPNEDGTDIIIDPAFP